jgi:hypothetical protein
LGTVVAIWAILLNEKRQIVLYTAGIVYKYKWLVIIDLGRILRKIFMVKCYQALFIRQYETVIKNSR